MGALSRLTEKRPPTHNLFFSQYFLEDLYVLSSLHEVCAKMVTSVIMAKGLNPTVQEDLTSPKTEKVCAAVVSRELDGNWNLYVYIYIILWYL